MNFKTPAEIEVMRESGVITAKVMQEVLSMAHAGVRLEELEKRAEELIRNSGGKPSFQTVSGYRYATCLNVNEGVVHGVPNRYSLKRGDILSVDLGVLLKGWHTDSAWTIQVDEEPTGVAKTFLETGERALNEAVGSCRPGNHLKDLSSKIQGIVEGQGYSVSRDLVGHGVGRNLHEDPQVPGFIDEDEEDLELKPGMVLAIEIIYMMGKSPIVVDKKDGWTISTEDGSIAALFEHTVAITVGGPVVLTKW